MKFLVWSVRKGGWWRPDAKGYTTHRRDAARVDLETATRWAMTGWQASEKEIPEDAIVPDLTSEATP